MKINYAKYFFALLLFGSNGIVASNIKLTSYEIVFWRTMIGSILLILLFFISGQKLTFLNNKRDLAVIVMVLSPVLFQEKLSRVKVIGFIDVLTGVLLVNGKASGNLGSLGLFCGVMSAVMYALMVVFNKKAKKVKGLENSMI